MRRFLILWLTLLAAFWLTRSVLSAALFARAEMDREAFWLLLVVPAVQALVLAWVTRSPSSRPLLASGRELLALPFGVGLVVTDAVLITAGLIWPDSPWLGLATGRVGDFYTGVKLALAGLAFGFLAFRGRGPRDAWIWLPLSGRSRVALLAAGLLFYAVFQLGASLEVVLQPLFLFELYEEFPWVVSSALLAAMLLLLASLEPLFVRHSKAAGAALTAAAATSLAAGLVTLLAMLPEPASEEPWSALIGGLALLSASFLLLAPVAALFPRKAGASAAPGAALVLATLLTAGAAPVSAQPLPLPQTPFNLGFETGAADGSLPGWVPSKPGEGFSFRAEVADADPFEGDRAARLVRTGRGDGLSGLLQVIDARPLRGRRVVLRGALRARAEPGRGDAFLYLQASPGGPAVPGPRAVEGWRLDEVTTVVGHDAETLQLGVLVSGEAEVTADAFSLAVAGGPGGPAAAGPPPARPLTEGGRENLAAFTRLVGLVRHFHPADTAARLDWDRFTVAAVGPVEAAAGPDVLAEVLSRLFAPVAPTVAVFRQGRDLGPLAAPPAANAGARPVGWRHYGLGTGTAESQASYRSERLTAGEPPSTPGRFLRPLAAGALAGRLVRLEAAVRAAPGTRAALFLEAAGADGLPLARERRPAEPSGDWRRLAVELTLPSQVSQLTLGLELASAGRAGLDDVRLTPSALDGDDAPLPSRLFQDGFEAVLPEPVPDGWILDYASEAAGFEATTSATRPAGGRRHAELIWEPDVALPELGTALTVDLGAGVSARVPLAVAGGGDRALPAGSESALYSGDDRATRLAAVVLAGAALEHFYPYFDAVPADWPASVRRALTTAATDPDGRAFQRTLSRLTADLHDGHAYAAWAGGDEDHRLPLLWRVIGNELVVTAADPQTPEAAAIRPGDVVLEIDGRPAAAALTEAAERVSASTPGFRLLKAAGALATGRARETRRLTLRRGPGEPFEVTLACTVPAADRERLRPPRPAPIAEVHPGIWYVDLDRTSDPEIERTLPRLAKAKGIVFDLRGYPSNVTPDLLFGHLIDRPVPFGGDRVPVRTRPDRVERYDLRRRWLQPRKPRLGARAVFLTGERAISRSEIYLSLVAEEKLGLIVGARTAGTRGEVDELPLPGGYRVYWTAARTLTADGKVFQGHGVIPDVAAEPTKEGIASGRDEMLEKAIEVAAAGKPADAPR